MLRLPLAVACVLLCAQSLFAGLALTVKDIGLMLRSGYSSKAILTDLEKQHFAETLDANSESYLLELRASPELIAALKSGQHGASLQEKIARVTVPIQQADEAKRMAQQAATRQAEERQQLAQRQSQSQIVVAPISGQSPEFLTPSEKAAKRRVEKAAEQQAAAEEAAMQPTRQQPEPSPFAVSNNDVSKEWEARNRVSEAVETARREARNNAESRARGGGEVIRSSNSYSSLTDDDATRYRIERSVEAARREEENNAKARANGGGEIHSSSNSFDPGPR